MKEVRKLEVISPHFSHPERAKHAAGEQLPETSPCRRIGAGGDHSAPRKAGRQRRGRRRQPKASGPSEVQSGKAGGEEVQERQAEDARPGGAPGPGTQRLRRRGACAQEERGELRFSPVHKKAVQSRKSPWKGMTFTMFLFSLFNISEFLHVCSRHISR